VSGVCAYESHDKALVKVSLEKVFSFISIISVSKTELLYSAKILNKKLKKLTFSKIVQYLMRDEILTNYVKYAVH
jgi:hypothetical protein